MFIKSHQGARTRDLHCRLIDLERVSGGALSHGEEFSAEGQPSREGIREYLYKSRQYFELVTSEDVKAFKVELELYSSAPIELIIRLSNEQGFIKNAELSQEMVGRRSREIVYLPRIVLK